MNKFSGKNDIVQRLVTGNLTEAERNGYSDIDVNSRDFSQEPREVSFGLTQEQKIAIYQDIKFRVADGASPDDIAKATVACMEEHLKEKEDEAYGTELNKGLIRRVE